MTEITGTKARKGRWPLVRRRRRLEGAAGRCGATGSGLAVYVVVALLPPHLTRR